MSAAALTVLAVVFASLSGAGHRCNAGRGPGTPCSLSDLAPCANTGLIWLPWIIFRPATEDRSIGGEFGSERLMRTGWLDRIIGWGVTVATNLDSSCILSLTCCGGQQGREAVATGLCRCLLPGPSLGVAWIATMLLGWLYKWDVWLLDWNV